MRALWAFHLPVGIVGRFDVLGRNDVEGQDCISSAIIYFSFVSDSTCSTKNGAKHEYIVRRSAEEILRLTTGGFTWNHKWGNKLSVTGETNTETNSLCFVPVCYWRLEIEIPVGRLLTHDQLTNILPVELTTLFMDESHCDSPLDPLQQKWFKISIDTDKLSF